MFLVTVGAIIAYNMITKVDPDLVILGIINENVNAKADNSCEGYFNATQEKTEDGETVDIDHYYSNNNYTVIASGNSKTYTCTEDGCGYSYVVKNK